MAVNIPTILPKKITDKYRLERNTFIDKDRRNKKGQFIKGNIPFDRTGIEHIEETKKKLRKARQGRKPNAPIEMKGKKFSRWTVLKFVGKRGKQHTWLCRCDCGNEKIVNGMTLRNGQSKSCGCLAKELITKRNKKNCGIKSPTYGKKGFFAGKKKPEQSIRIKGKENPNWKGGITPEIRKIRNSIEFRLWREAVFARDNWTCQKCSQWGGELCAHHIKNFAQYPELRFAIDNGITFCKKCHKEFHKKYGIRDNTQEQIKEFIC